jgi:hypothetical protein
MVLSVGKSQLEKESVDVIYKPHKNNMVNR